MTGTETKTAKFSLIIVLIAGMVWLGGLNIRAVVGFDLLQPGTLDFKLNIHPYVERTVFGLVARISMIIDIAYAVLWFSALVYLRATRLSLKEEGWLMMNAILFYIFTPVEIYTAILDMKMWYLDYVGSNDLVEFRKLFIHRAAALAGVPMIALLSYYSIMVISVIRPFRRTAPAQ